MEKSPLDVLEKEPKPVESKETDQQRIAESVDTYPETGGVTMDEAKRQEGEIKITKVKNEIKKNFPTEEPKIVTKEVVIVELPLNTPPIFQKMPEISAYVKEYMDEYNSRKTAKGVKGMFHKFWDDVDELKKFAAAGDKAIHHHYRKALAEGGEKEGPMKAWEYVKELIGTKYTGVTKGGETKHKGRFKAPMGEDTALDS